MVLKILVKTHTIYRDMSRIMLTCHDCFFFFLGNVFFPLPLNMFVQSLPSLFLIFRKVRSIYESVFV